MGDAVMTHIIHNKTLRSSQQYNESYIFWMVLIWWWKYIWSKISHLLLMARLLYDKNSCCTMTKTCNSLFTAIKPTQTGGTYHFLFAEENSPMVDKFLDNIDDKPTIMGTWNECNSYCHYITANAITVAGIQHQSKIPHFWKLHYQNLCGTIPSKKCHRDNALEDQIGYSGCCSLVALLGLVS